MDPKINELEDEDLNMGQGNYGDGSSDHGGNGVEDPPMGMLRGNEPELRGDPQPQPIWREYLYARFCKMKPSSFEGFTNPFYVDKWLSLMETNLDFMELNDRKRLYV